jgi:hypothetical protein
MSAKQLSGGRILVGEDSEEDEEEDGNVKGNMYNFFCISN